MIRQTDRPPVTHSASRTEYRKPCRLLSTAAGPQENKGGSKSETPERWPSMRLRAHFGFQQYTVILLVLFSQGAERLETGLSVKLRMRCSCRGVHRSECSPGRRLEADCEASKPVVQIASGAVPVDRTYPGPQ